MLMDVPTMASLPARFIRAHIALLSLAALTVGAACQDPTAPLPREGAPDELLFSFGGFGIDATTLELRGATVAMWRSPADWRPGIAIDTTYAVPTAEAWREFWITAKGAGVQRWRSRYAADNIIDGVGWSLRLVAGAFALEASGSNAYPDWRGREHELEMTEEFRAFRTALGNLVGEEM
jgi:hypothetical protein